MKEILIFLSTVFAIVSYVVYAIAILKGKAKPHRTTRLVLLLITTIATASLFAQHNTVAIWLTGTCAVFSALIFILSFRYGMGGWEKSDIVCLCIAIVGIVLWQVTKNPVLALYASVMADFTGIVPTLIKTYHYPDTEVWYFFGLDVLAATCSLLAISTWTPQEYSYPMYLFLINTVMVILILRPQLSKYFKA